uniref:Retrotransposon protein, putative, Ty1-copia subclass n=1 Tax=Tanacetum cinerariifolium TaxID=118510 RepID=A0A6L2P6H2_TANCI|nr:retrotransposon protein, putative, Ty1-copia subclass [Tanacetum cinerariifolium]
MSIGSIVPIYKVNSKVTSKSLRTRTRRQEVSNFSNLIYAVLFEVDDRETIGGSAYGGQIAICYTVDLAKLGACKEGEIIHRHSIKNPGWPEVFGISFDVNEETSTLQPSSMTPELHRQFKNSSPYDMIQELKSMFEKQARVDRFDLIQTFHACKQEEGKPVAAYVLQMKGHVDQLERLGYMLPQDLIVGLILNGLTKDFASFVRNYNMHNMGKTIGELHAMLIEYEKGLPKKVETPQELGHWKRNCHIYLAELLKKKKQVRFASSSGIFTIELFAFLNKSQEKSYIVRHGSIYDESYNFVVSFWDYALEFATRILNMVPTKKVDKTQYELWYGKVPNFSYLKVWGCEALVKQDTPDKLQQRSVKCIFIGFPKEMIGYYFYFPPENKIVVARCAEFFEKNLITQEVSGRSIDLEEIQDEDTSPFEITSEIPMEVEGFKPPQEEVILIRRSEKTHRAPNRLCLNVEVDEHSLGDLNEPASYKATMLDSKSNKWIDAMNAEIQSMIDNMVWVLVDLPPNCKTVGNYKETFSPVTDIRAIRILISIVTFYDYEIWQMDVKTAFLNGYLDEDIYMVQPEGFVDPNHPKKASGSNVIFHILFVDDIIKMGNHIPSLQSVKDYLGKCFAMKDLWEAAFILGIKIYRDRNPKAELRVDCYCNAGFKIDIDDMKYQIGYVFILNRGAVDWKSSK